MLKTNKNKISFVIFFGIIITTLFCACSEEAANKRINHYIATMKEKSLKATNRDIESLNLEPPSPFRYNSKTLKGPFGTKEVTPVKKAIIQSANPLLVYPVTMLKFIGTLFSNGQSFAFVMTPDNKLYRVTIGDYIGDHNGQVIAISPTELVILEHYVDVGKRPAQNKVVLKLKDESE